MLHVDEERQDTPIETLHLYVVREPLQQISWRLWLPLAISLFALSLIVALCVLSPYRQQVTRSVIRVPAVFSPLQYYTASAQIQPTGIKTYQATKAYGILTITNGSVIAATLPAGMIVTASDGREVVTLASVFVPSGNALGYGYARVAAQAVTGGIKGNIAALAINSVYGDALYIRNLAAFSGGRDAYAVKVITAQDKQNATSEARAILTAFVMHNLAYPCKEALVTRNIHVTLTWACQYVTFTIPAYMHVTAYQIVGKRVVVEVWYVARPQIISFK